MNPTGPVSVTVTKEDGVRVIRLDGELDLAAVPMADLQTAEVFDGADAVVLDLTGLSFIDSAGLRLLDALRRHADDVVPLAFVPTRTTARLLQLVGLDAVMRLFERVEDAVAAVRTAPTTSGERT